MNRTRVVFILILLIALLIVALGVIIQRIAPAPATTAASTTIPTPTAMPQAMVSADEAEIYAGPNPLIYPVLATARQGDRFEIAGRDGAIARFWQVCCVGGQAGWIAADAVRVSGASNQAPIAPLPTLVAPFAIQTHHGTYITALDGARADGWKWALKGQATAVAAWEQFELYVLENGKIALRTYFGRYVTANGLSIGWRLRAESFELSRCGEFTLIDLGDGWVALKTCHDTCWTAMDGAREEEWAWAIRAETDVVLEWEQFRLIPLQ